MKVTTRIRILTRVHRFLFILLVLVIAGLLAWLSTRYKYEADWTNNSRYTLTEPSQQLLAGLPSTIAVTIYLSTPDNYPVYQEFFERYQRHKTNFSVDFINPYTIPTQARQRGIQDGEIQLAYQGRTERVFQLSEQAISTALLRLSRSENAQIVFLTGHGERSPVSSNNADLMNWSRELIARGFDVQTLNFAQTPEIPLQTRVLIIASPQKPLAVGSIELVMNYVRQGGNLLWLQETSDLQGLTALASTLGVEIQPGMIIDPVSYQLHGHATLASVTEYGVHPVTQGMQQLLTLFPEATALHTTPQPDWDVTRLLTTHNRAWLETGDLTQQVTFDEGVDADGPFDIGLALTRTLPSDPASAPPDSAATATTTVTASAPTPPQQQRVIVIGDGDFLSNAFLHQLGNLDLSMKILNWLAKEDDFIELPSRLPSDARLQLSDPTAIFIFTFFVLLLPISLLSTSLYVWLSRRKA